jgi:ankyrin repeat protein
MDVRVVAGRLIAAGLLVGPCVAATPSAQPVKTDLRLIGAIRERDEARASSLIREHVGVNETQPDGATALAWAVYLDEANIVDELLRSGAKVDTADEYGETPLTLASATGDVPVMEKLIAAGADAKVARWNGETALMIAARSGSVPGVKLLIAHGADLNAVEARKGQNALMWAAAEGHCEVVDALIQAGADVKAVSKGGFTPLVFAANKGDVQSVKLLLKAGLSPNYVLPNGTGVLHVAVSGGKTEMVQALLDDHADVNLADKKGLTPLHMAAQAGNLEMVKLLLAKGANPNLLTAAIPPPTGAAARNPFRGQVGQQTALLMAAKANHEDVMRVLVDGGADPKIKAQDGTTLLMAAAGSGHLATVEYAYGLDPDVNAVTARKSTVVHAAVTGTMQISTQADICDVIKFLASKGADLDAEDANGRTPIVIANFLPIDKAVTLMNDLIVASGKTPKKSAKR